ncbi:MAG: hypothetical protein M1153_02135 [Patescibacteria group bacterium]|nr:hypothetical protein [Patescibacteria group bacterium]
MAENEQNKETKARSRLYPRYDLEESIKFIEAVSKLGGNRVSTQAVAAELNKAINNSTFIGRVSSSKQFGLLIQESGKLSLSSLGKEIMFPLGEADKRTAIKKAFSTPAFYRELIDGFQGKVVPDAAALSNRLFHDYNIEAAAKEVAARNFIRSAEYAGLLNNGILVITENDTGYAQAASSETAVPSEMAGRTSSSTKADASEGKQFIFDFVGGIRLIVPRNEKTSEAIADGELKNVRKELSVFAGKCVVPEDKKLEKDSLNGIG